MSNHKVTKAELTVTYDKQLIFEVQHGLNKEEKLQVEARRIARNSERGIPGTWTFSIDSRDFVAVAEEKKSWTLYGSAKLGSGHKSLKQTVEQAVLIVYPIDTAPVYTI